MIESHQNEFLMTSVRSLQMSKAGHNRRLAWCLKLALWKEGAGLLTKFLRPLCTMKIFTIIESGEPWKCGY